MHGSRVYKLFGMGTAAVRIVFLYRMSSGSRVYNHYQYFFKFVKKFRKIHFKIPGITKFVTVARANCCIRQF